MGITVVLTVTMTVVGYWSTRSTLDASLQSRVEAIAVTVALELPPAALASISSAKSAQTPEYEQLERIVRGVTTVNQTAAFPLRFVYLLVPTDEHATSGWDLAVDSDPRDSPDWTIPGTPYNFSPSVVPVAPIDGSVPTVRHLDDQWGSWISGYAPVRTADGAVVGLVGVDIAYRDFVAQLDWLLWWACTLAVILSVVMYTVVEVAINRLLRPIGQLREFISTIGAGHFDQRLDTNPLTEFLPVVNELNTMASQLGERAKLVRKNAELSENVTRQSTRLEAIADVDAQMNEIQDIDILIEAILADARRLVGCDAGSVLLREGDELLLTYLQNDTLRPTRADQARLVATSTRIRLDGGSICGYAALTGESVVADDAYHIPADRPYRFNPEVDQSTGYRTRAVLAIPLRTSAGKIVGVLQLLNPVEKNGEPRLGFSKEDIDAVTHFSSAATVALERAALTRSIVLRMIRMAEMRDPSETAHHVNRVAAYSVVLYEGLARKHAFDSARVQRERDTLRIAAMLHDVGKVGIPDAILKKAGRLTAEEYAGMQKHAEIGAQLFAERESVLDRSAFEVALHHHERWDGAGYPGMVTIPPSSTPPGSLGGVGVSSRSEPPPIMQGEGIPLFARIVAVADVFDALSSKRQYKDAWPEDRVLKEMSVNAGRQFDPELIEILLENLPQMRSVAARYS